MFKFCTPVAFRDALIAAKARMPEAVRPNLHEYGLRDYAKMRTFLTSSAWAGYAIKQDGELANVFSLRRGKGAELIADAVANGARHLDCFDGPLVGIYERAGFREVRRVPFNTRYRLWPEGHGSDVVYMEYRG